MGCTNRVKCSTDNINRKNAHIMKGEGCKHWNGESGSRRSTVYENFGVRTNKVMKVRVCTGHGGSSHQ